MHEKLTIPVKDLKMKNVLSMSGKGSYEDIEPRIIDITQSYLKNLMSNNYGILVNRLNDYYTISVFIIQDDN